MRWRRRLGAGRRCLCKLQQLCLHLRDLIVRPVVTRGGKTRPKKKNRFNQKNADTKTGKKRGGEGCIAFRKEKKGLFVRTSSESLECSLAN
jgi:hypothetical protein